MFVKGPNNNNGKPAHQASTACDNLNALRLPAQTDSPPVLPTPHVQEADLIVTRTGHNYIASSGQVSEVLFVNSVHDDGDNSLLVIPENDSRSEYTHRSQVPDEPHNTNYVQTDAQTDEIQDDDNNSAHRSEDNTVPSVLYA